MGSLQNNREFPTRTMQPQISIGTHNTLQAKEIVPRYCDFTSQIWSKMNVPSRCLRHMEELSGCLSDHFDRLRTCLKVLWHWILVETPWRRVPFPQSVDNPPRAPPQTRLWKLKWIWNQEEADEGEFPGSRYEMHVEGDRKQVRAKV